MRVLLFLSVFGLLFLTGCGKKPEIGIFDPHGKQVASLELDGDGALVKKSGLDIGHVEGDDIFAENGKNVGTVMLEDSRVLIADMRGNAVGSLEKETDCFGKTAAIMGRIGEKIEPTIAAGACYLALLANRK